MEGGVEVINLSLSLIINLSQVQVTVRGIGNKLQQVTMWMQA